MVFESFLKDYQNTFCERILPEIDSIISIEVANFEPHKLMGRPDGQISLWG